MPVRFEIHHGGKPLAQFTPSSAYALGQEGIPIAGDVFFRDGLLIVSRPDNQAIGVGLLWDCGPGVGQYVLETARLKPREKPYLLNLELARGRLMRILQKMEDWNLFDYPRTEQLAATFRKAQMTLAQAMGHLPNNPVAAAVSADSALSQAMALGDELALFHAELLLGRRRAAGTVARHVLGVRAEPEILTPPEAFAGREALVAGFDYAVVPTNWRHIQPREAELVTAPLDQLLDLLAGKRMPVVAGPLVDLQESNVPDWMAIWEHDYDTLRDLAYEHVNRLVQRYRKQVSVWNVVAGLHAHSAFTLTFEQIIEFTRLLVGQVKAALPAARTLVTVRQPFGEYHARHRNTVPPMLYAEMIAQGGIPFEAFGLELEMGIPSHGLFARDLFQISSALDKFATLGKPLFLTAMCVPGRNYPDPADLSDGRLDPSSAGQFRGPWDATLQADWIEAVTRLALSKPYVESLAWSNLSDRRPSMPSGGLLDANFKPKPAYERIQAMRQLYHQWSGRRQPPAPPSPATPVNPS
jgi:GH35 family endo-1,4-beta-xylanase